MSLITPNYIPFQSPVTKPTVGAAMLYPTGQGPQGNTGPMTPWTPFSVTSWLGIASGSFMRFLDTNILPDIEIRMMLAPGTIIASDDASNVRYTLKGFSLQVESVSFGDGSYRPMVDQRMATRKPLMVPITIGLALRAQLKSATSINNSPLAQSLSMQF